MHCRICDGRVSEAFRASVLGKYTAVYTRCDRCELIRADNPHWLAEAYASPINVDDTGILQRNLLLSRKATVLLYGLWGPKCTFVDYAGGYGLFARLMRDIGFDFYWLDRYTPNLFARGFEYKSSVGRPAAVTTFESLEHFVDPVEELSAIIRLSRNVVFSTQLHSGTTPEPSAWPYYGFAHGQHVSLYSHTTLRYLARRFGFELCSDGSSLHMLSERPVGDLRFRVLLRLSRLGASAAIRARMRPLTTIDMLAVRRA